MIDSSSYQSFGLLVALVFILAIVGGKVAANPVESSDSTISLLSRYLAMDTTNPPGNELPAAVFLKGLLDAEGIETKLFELGNNRANLFARLHGDGSRRPVILLHHIDVVPAEPKFWSVPPFSGKIVKGRIFGRGAVDMKSKGLIDLMTMIAIKHSGAKLKRDIILLAVAGEEVDSIGAKSFIRDRPDLISNAEFLLNEGQTILADKHGDHKRYLVSVAEKLNVWITLVFKGQAGHGSLPNSDSSVERLLRAANRLLTRRADFHVPAMLQDYVAMLLEGTDIRHLPGYSKDLKTSLENPVFLRAISSNTHIRASMQNTICPTMLKGSEKINSIPNEATLGIDCRLLPGTDPAQFIDDLRKTLRDPGVEIRVEDTPEGAVSRMAPVDSEFMTALRATAAKFDPGVPVTPVILLSTSDSIFFSQLGIQCYGFEPYALTEAEYDLSHANDESMAVSQVGFGITLMTDLLTRLCR